METQHSEKNGPTKHFGNAKPTNSYSISKQPFTRPGAQRDTPELHQNKRLPDRNDPAYLEYIIAIAG